MSPWTRGADGTEVSYPGADEGEKSGGVFAQGKILRAGYRPLVKTQRDF